MQRIYKDHKLVSWKLNNALQVQKTLEIQESVREDDKKHKQVSE